MSEKHCKSSEDAMFEALSDGVPIVDAGGEDTIPMRRPVNPCGGCSDFDRVVGALSTSTITEVQDELKRAMAAHDPFNSAHEGYAVLLEELDELWDEVKLKPHLRDPEAMRHEAIQVAAMAIRFVVDVCGGSR